MSEIISAINKSLNIDANPKWPPILGKYIAVRRGDSNKTYIGSVRVSEPDQSIIHLIKPFRNVDEYEEVVDFIPIDKDPEKFYIVFEADTWDYVPIREIAEIKRRYSMSLDDLSGREALITDSRSRDMSTLIHSKYDDADEEPNIDADITTLINLCNVGGTEFLYNHVEGREIDGIDRTYEKESDLELDEKVMSYERELYDALDKSRYCEPEEIEVVDTQMITKLVRDERALQDNASRIMQEIRRRLLAEENESKIFDSMRLIYYDNAVHVLREGIPIKEVITPELLQSNCNNCRYDPEAEATNNPEDSEQDKLENPLTCLDWQYDRPIDHNQLKFILYGTESAFVEDRARVREAELVLSQEYIIALTPEPRYHLWTLLRLIQIWYADPVLVREIRMIKYIVNVYRARTDKTYNRENGIQYMIGVFPRYGKASAVRVIQRLSYWFSLYTSAIAWRNNAPSYFKMMNDLISYTNSSQALKLYYRRLIASDNKKDGIFKDNYSLIRDTTQGSRDILHQYMPLNHYT